MSKRGQKRKIDDDTRDTEVKRGRADGNGLKYGLQWSSYDDRGLNEHKHPALYYLHSSQLDGCDKIAAFDIDYTLIITKSGKKFPVNAQDWLFFDKSVPAKLKELNDSGYRVLFISNQGGIEKGTTKFADFKLKISDILAQADIPIFVLISTGETHVIFFFC
jgi:bifunctional polynucleotide phosphatase/kinase